MIQIFRTVDGEIRREEEITKNCWVALTDPSASETAEIAEQFGIDVHAIVTVQDIHEYLKEDPKYADVLAHMEQYMAQYCRF